MRLRTIWTMPGMSLRERLERNTEWWSITIAALIPARLRYYVTLMEIGHATRNSENVPATPLDEILRNMNHPDKKH